MIRSLILVGAGGAAGSILRYLITLSLQDKSVFPIATIAINALGCFILGLVAGWAVKHSNLSQDVVLMAGTGFCGGFTTFSSFALDSNRLVEKGHGTMSIIYIALSVFTGIALCRSGYWLTNK